jgi:hypothetical protein
MREDRLLERAQRLSRLEPGPLDEDVARPAVCLQRFGLTSTAVEGEHELLPEALAQRVASDQRLELGDQRDMAAELEIGIDPLLDGDQP